MIRIIYVAHLYNPFIYIMGILEFRFRFSYHQNFFWKPDLLKNDGLSFVNISKKLFHSLTLICIVAQHVWQLSRFLLLLTVPYPENLLWWQPVVSVLGARSYRSLVFTRVRDSKSHISCVLQIRQFFQRNHASEPDIRRLYTHWR